MDLLGRLIWLALGIGGVVLAAPLLDRVAARPSVADGKPGAAGFKLRWIGPLLRPFARGAFGALAVAELTACLRERRRWWWATFLVTWGLQALGSAEVMRVGLLLGWLLPLDVLARGILRERDHGTGALVFIAAGARSRLLCARCGVAVVLVMLATAPALVRLSATSPIGAFAAYVVALSIASAGIASGAVFRTSRPFELALVALIYVALQGAAVFDVGVGAAATLVIHMTALAVAWIAIAVAWPRLARASI